MTIEVVATGGTITEDGDYKIHTFTASGTFEVTSGSADVWYVVVAGGGGGGGFGGGGAGGYRSNAAYDYPVTEGSYTVTIGAAGTAGGAGTKGGDGGNSVFDTITSTGGGGGGAFSNTNHTGRNGGSGGGGGTNSTTPFAGQPGGTGTVGQGNDGGDGVTGGTGAGGGGGASAVGADAAVNTGGNGGAGTASSISGSSVTYAGGGGGAGTNTKGTGGAGGGGNGGQFTGSIAATAATPSTGGGGGGGYNTTGGLGGTGIVIIRYRYRSAGRDLMPGLLEATLATSLAPIGLVEMQFGSGTVRFWTGRGSLVVDGETYTGTGTLGKISTIEETTELKAVSVDLELSGVPSEVLTIANGEDWQGRDVIIKYAALQQSGNLLTLVDDPFQIFKGKMDQMTLVDGRESTVTISAESKQIDLERRSPRRYTAEDQRKAFTDDAGCDAVASLQQKEIVWGA